MKLCVDFRQLNEITISDNYPLPIISDILDQVGGHKYYTTLDLEQGFQQVKLDHRDTCKCKAQFGHCEFVRMPFGMRNAPASFQRLINTVLRELIGKVCFCYIDDIIIFADSCEQHVERFNMVM